MTGVFLTAQWRHLAMLNYRIDPALLRPLVPSGTELDQWSGHAYVSVVGFLFLDTRVLGVPIPFHRNFEELNLRFYVRRDAGGEMRRAVTFVKELVPRAAIAWTARLAYNDPYRAVPMQHSVTASSEPPRPERVEYRWRYPLTWGRLAVDPVGKGALAAEGSEEEFITEHYWGYTRQRDGGTVEYRVTHPKWRLWQVHASSLSGDLAALYGAAFAESLMRPPDSAFLAEGSPVEVYRPTHLPRR